MTSCPFNIHTHYAEHTAWHEGWHAGANTVRDIWNGAFDRAASADTHPQGGDAEQAPFTSGAVPSETSADAQPLPPLSDKEKD